MSKNVKFSLFLLPLILLAAVPSCAQKICKDPAHIVKRMTVEEAKLDYSGTKVAARYQNGKELVYKFTIQRQAPDKMRLEFIAPPEMKGKGFVKSGENFWRISPDMAKGERHYRLYRMHKNMEIKNFDLLSKNYNLIYGEMEKVAKRPCYVISIEPKMGTPISRKVWIDARYYLTLRSEEYFADKGKKGKKSSFTFETISYFPRFSPDTFTVPLAEGAKSVLRKPARRNVTIDEARSLLNVPVLTPEYIPSGFQLEEMKMVRRRNREFLHMVYSDGLSTLSIFQGKITPEHRRWTKKFEQVKRNGELVYRIRRGHLTILNSTVGKTNVTLLGEIDPEELEKIFSSLR